MFPDPCGAEFERAVRAGADPKQVVPNEYAVVHGGTAPMPPTGTRFSGAVGPSVESAAAAVPHGKVHVSTVGAVRAAGGVVEWKPEVSRFQTVNRQHVNITEARPTVFSDPRPNPVPRRQRIDGDQP
jgi:hypothetical protein